MQLIIDATQISKNLLPLTDEVPVGLLPVCGKPILEYTLELCKKSGFSEVMLVCSRNRKIIEDTLTDGARWGLRIKYLDSMNEVEDGQALVLRADCLYNLNIGDFVERAESLFHPQVTAVFNAKPVIFFCDGEKGISGHSEVFSSVDAKGATISLIDSQVLTIDSYKSFHLANMEVLNGCFEHCVIDPHQQGFNLVRGPGASVNSESVTDGTACIGEQSKIAPTARLSGTVVVGENAIVDDSVKIRNSVVFPNTYVGRSLKLDNTIVKGNFLIRVDKNLCTQVEDTILLRSLDSDPGRFEPKSLFKGFRSRLGALSAART